jgi:ribonuclease PH
VRSRGLLGRFQMSDSSSDHSIKRLDSRLDHELRPLILQPGIAPHATGSVLINTGSTQVICAVTVEESVPRWMKEQGVTGGWITAEYSMLPYSTLTRRQRDVNKGKLDGRSTEIQRLIGRALRAVTDLEAVGSRTIWIDCDVLQADGGTRTAAITGASVAMALAFDSLMKKGQITTNPMKSLVAAVSVGLVEGRPMVDLNYLEDRDAAVDMNLVMTAEGQFVELQGAGEESTFSSEELSSLMQLGRSGIESLIARQRQFLEEQLEH